MELSTRSLMMSSSSFEKEDCHLRHVTALASGVDAAAAALGLNRVQERRGGKDVGDDWLGIELGRGLLAPAPPGEAPAGARGIAGGLWYGRGRRV
eukprot:scaffold251969_cov48-Prasinocladus_malaysianus.AAC.1